MPTGQYDVAVIGAGAAGMMAAATAGQRGLRVVLIDHARRLAEKIRISGGGRCNFTNIGAGPANFISQNPAFCRSALAAYTPRHFLELVERHGIAWHEKHKGQLFCDGSSEEIIAMLRQECEWGKVDWRMPCEVQSIEADGPGFVLATSNGRISTRQLVLATGGMAIPQLGATDFALRIARQFGLKIIEPRPALVPLTFDSVEWQAFSALSGVAVEVVVHVASEAVKPPSGGQISAQGSAKATASPGGSSGRPRKKAVPTEFLEDLLFTHRGLSGPAILQISSYWNHGDSLIIDLAPDQDLEKALLTAKAASRKQLSNVLAELWPRRLAEQWLAHGASLADGLVDKRIAEIPDKQLRALAGRIHGWSLKPNGSLGYKKAEVMRGGVDTRELQQKTMEARAVPGLYFIGEAVDVTGWLGGYNFQWAWASGVACGRALQ